MDFPEDKYSDEIESYVAGGLSEQERADFEKRLKENPQLAEDVRIQRSIYQQVRRLQRKKYVEGILQEIFEEKEEGLKPIETDNAPNKKEDDTPAPATPVISLRQWMTIGLSVAAAVLALLFLIKLLNPTPSGIWKEAPLTELVVAEQNSVSLSGTTGDQDSLREVVYMYFKRDSFDLALGLSNTFLNSFPDDESVRRIRGLLRAQKKDIDGAINDWDHIFLGGTGFSRPQKCSIGILIFWTLVHEKRKSELEEFFQRWDELGNCSSILESDRKRVEYAKEHLEEILR